ncbi:unnamed protein product, partial [Mesorhabditis spiculigera]
MAYRQYEQGTSGMNFDRFLDRFDENTVTKLKRHYWTAKQMFRNKMGKKEDELLTASDADFDSQVTLFNSIKRTSDQLLEASNNYHGFLLDAAQSENGVGKYLKDRGKEQRREETKKVMIAVGRAFLYASHQRAAISQPLLRFYEEICVFNERAIFDCGQTVEAAERAKTEYRGSLLWMKQESEELDPSNFRQMDRFREVQATVRLNKERLDRLKEDTLQKVDLLSASRSHLLSHLLGRYLELLTTYYQKTGTIYATLAKNLSVYDHYDFEILTELIEPSRKAAQKARQESFEKEREEEVQQKAVEAEQPDLMQFNDRDETSLRYLFGGESPSEERIVTDRRRLADDEERPDSPLVGEAEIGMDALEGALLHPEKIAVNSEAYLNTSSTQAFIIISPIGSCEFYSGRIPCECFPVEGDYGLVQNETTLLTFSVGPPAIQISAQKSASPLLSELSVHIRSRLCQEQQYHLQMWHRTHEVLPDSEDYWVKVEEKTVMLKNTEKFIEFPCETTARTGVYRFDLIGPNNVTVTAEKTLFVNASTEVKLQLREGSIFPHCSDEYQIRWTNPRCTSSPLQFRLRLLAVPEGNPDHVEERAIYVEEIGLDAGDSWLSLPCSQFDILYEQYCFELVSLHPLSEQFHQWDVKCIHTEPVETVHGGWSPWSSWSPCEGVCGTGVRTRSRACDSPKPKRGRACSGDVIERLTCPLKPCPEGRFLLTDSNCTCGCTALLVPEMPLGDSQLGIVIW